MSESLQGPFCPRIHLRHVADQGDTLEPSGAVAAAVKRAAIERAHKSVVMDEAGHVNVMQWLSSKKFQRFGFTSLS